MMERQLSRKDISFNLHIGSFQKAGARRSTSIWPAPSLGVLWRHLYATSSHVRCPIELSTHGLQNFWCASETEMDFICWDLLLFGNLSSWVTILLLTLTPWLPCSLTSLSPQACESLLYPNLVSSHRLRAPFFLLAIKDLRRSFAVLDLCEVPLVRSGLWVLILTGNSLESMENKTTCSQK